MSWIFFDDPLSICFTCSHRLIEHDDETEGIPCLICGCEVISRSGSVYLLDDFFGALQRIAYCHDACKVTLDARTEVRGPEAT